MAETWQIIVALGLLLVGIGVGMLLRPSNKKLQKRAAELENELSETRERLDSHRSEVSKHFSQTSDLFRDLTQQYTALYAHLADGARTLAPERMLEIGQGFNMAVLERGPGPSDALEEDQEPTLELDATPESAAEPPTLEPPTAKAELESADEKPIDEDLDLVAEAGTPDGADPLGDAESPVPKALR